MIKGAPDRLLERCTSYTGEGEASYVLEDTILTRSVETKDQWSRQGTGVILLAHKALSRTVIKSTLSFSGFETEMMKLARPLTLVSVVSITNPPVGDSLNPQRKVSQSQFTLLIV